MKITVWKKDNSQYCITGRVWFEDDTLHITTPEHNTIKEPINLVKAFEVQLLP